MGFVCRALLSSLIMLTPVLASAQGGATSSVAGVVKDEGGGVMPRALVLVTSNATGTKSEAVTK